MSPGACKIFKILSRECVYNDISTSWDHPHHGIILDMFFQVTFNLPLATMGFITIIHVALGRIFLELFFQGSEGKIQVVNW